MKLRLALLLFLLPALFLQAENLGADSVSVQKSGKFKEKSKGLFSKIGHLLNDLDTAYVEPNKYNFAFMLENSNWYEHYRIRTSEGLPQSLSIAPNMSYKLGGYFGWKWIFLGWSIDLRDIGSKHKSSSQKTEFGLSLYSSVVGCDIYKRKSGSNFKIRNTNGIFQDDELPSYNKNFDGFTVDIQGMNAYWVFNHKRFSYPAAYSQSTNQRKSAGSFIAGFSFSKHNIHFNPELLPEPIFERLDSSFLFHQIKYVDYSLSLGYAFNWVFAKNCLLSLSLTPAIAYKKSKVNSEEKYYPSLKNINFDLITRAGIVWNNTKYFVGTSLVMHTYDYKSDKFDLSNSFGTIRIYAGFNFKKKKAYKNK